MFNFITPINSTSYGMTGLNFCNEFTKAGVKFGLFPIDQRWAPGLNHQFKDAFQQALQYDVDAPCVRLWHQFDLSHFVGRGKRIGYTIFEVDGFNEKEIHHLENCDEIWVPTNWAKTLIQTTKQQNVKVVPLGVDTTRFKPVQKTNDKYVFLNIGKIEVRKGHDILHELFSKAFEKDDNVELWMSWNNPFLPESEVKKWESLYKNSRLGDKIKFIPRVEDMSDLINSASCIIQPSRAEGWNLPLLEAMACGKPVITTNYSAHTEYCNGGNSFLVDIKEKERAFDNRFFLGDGQWASIKDPQKSDFIEYMRHVYKNDIRENLKGIETAEAFTWSKAACTFTSYL